MHKYYLLTCLFLLLFSFCTKRSNNTNNNKQIFVNVKSFGAKADGKTKNTEAIQKAINHCADKGGGTVFFPAGEYLTAPVKLKSNIKLRLDPGCTILGSKDFNDYPFVQTRWEGTKCKGFMPLIYGYKVKNVAITGKGTINGQGKVWWDQMRKMKKKENYPDPSMMELTQKLAKLNKEAPKLKPNRTSWRSQFLRPVLVQFYDCKNVLMRDVHLTKPAFWTVHPVFCENVTIDNIYIKNPENSPNTDGVNPESSKNVHIANSHFDVGDDCIAIKSGIDKQGREIGIPSENITITNCTMIHGHGGIVIGSEMSGGIKNITVTNCVFEETTRGIRVKTARGRGGTIENFRVSNIMMNNIEWEAIKLNTCYHQNNENIQPVSEKTPVLKDFRFSNISIDSAKKAIYILGLKEMPIQNIGITDVYAKVERGYELYYSENIDIRNLDLTVYGDRKNVIKNCSSVTINGIQK